MALSGEKAIVGAAVEGLAQMDGGGYLDLVCIETQKNQKSHFAAAWKRGGVVLRQKAVQSGSKIHFMANLSIAELHNLKYYLCKHIRRFVLVLPAD